MCGKNSGLVTRILELNPNASWTHCNLHRAALVSKCTSDDFKNVLNTSIKIVNLKSKPLQSRLFEKLCEEMGSNHKSLLLHTEVRWLSKGKVLTRLTELREEVAIFLEGKSGNYDCFETFQTFVMENEAKVDDDIIIEISELKTLFQLIQVFYFLEEMKNIQEKKWIMNTFEPDITSGISTKAEEELFDLSEDALLEMNFNSRKLMQFWVSFRKPYSILSTEALKVLLSFSSSYHFEVGFLAMVGIKNKFRNKLQLSNSLRLKLTYIDVDVNAILDSNKKQAHPSHTPRC
ncbi:zinc finger BED domain-containing protein 5-like [Limulus polyphemus]|uniref:Zinc finger BED domain-containing protein 5-like n=1 Tax=Limulus polyphemus TaxID=6850 RepID=A0ABM1BT31_LIMPO|nr:zinc finger BED domain-containing protein 5-like [Limulus polyphemus]